MFVLKRGSKLRIGSDILLRADELWGTKAEGIKVRLRVECPADVEVLVEPAAQKEGE